MQILITESEQIIPVLYNNGNSIHADDKKVN
jgi:hypothetical protein